jgi:hypothetical protein
MWPRDCPECRRSGKWGLSGEVLNSNEIRTLGPIELMEPAKSRFLAGRGIGSVVLRPSLDALLQESDAHSLQYPLVA